MKNLITIITAILLTSCVSKETYIEKRTLTYPKGQVPHIKEMYLKNGTTVHSTERYAGVPSEPQVGDDEAILFPPEWSNEDLPSHEPVHPTSITIGSSKSDVAKIQGTPTRITPGVQDEWWWYDHSYIVFDSRGGVTSWYQSRNNPLRVAIN